MGRRTFLQFLMLLRLTSTELCFDRSGKTKNTQNPTQTLSRNTFSGEWGKSGSRSLLSHALCLTGVYILIQRGVYSYKHSCQSSSALSVRVSHLMHQILCLIKHPTHIHRHPMARRCLDTHKYKKIRIHEHTQTHTQTHI